jgi:hypothetical protein
MRAAQDEANEYYSEDNIGIERKLTVWRLFGGRKVKDLTSSCVSSLRWQLAVHLGYLLPLTILSTSWIEQDAR